MKWQEVESKWSTVRSKFHTQWSKLTEADLNAIKGQRTQLIDKLQQRYSLDKKKAEQQAESFVKTLH